MAEMLHQTATPALESMSREHLSQRNGVYYFRMRIPRELKRAGIVLYHERKPQKHEITFSLKTRDFKSACSKVLLHALCWRQKFDSELERLQAARDQIQARRLLASVSGEDIATSCKPSIKDAATILTDERVRAVAIRYFIERQRDAAKQIEAFRVLPLGHQEEVISDLLMEVRNYEGGNNVPPIDLDAELRAHLESLGLENVPSDSSPFDELRRLYRAAIVEDCHRRLAILTGKGPSEFNIEFKSVHASSPLPDLDGGISLGELLTKFEQSQKKKRVSDKTHMANAPVFRALREHFGEPMAIAKIGPSAMEGFFDFLETVPANATVRYRGKSLEEAALLEQKQPTPRFLEHRSMANYHGRIVAIFEYAKSMGWVSFNPASIQPLLARFRVDKKSDREPFTTEELNTLFRAPVYTGCSDEDRWYLPGKCRPRRGRFWVPLLALFQGLRCNEACQLEWSDIQEIEGIHVMKITDEADNENDPGSGKRLKNRASKNPLPIHPILIQMGFLDYVRVRATAGDGSLLFPDLPRKKDGTFADIFSKWFRRFLDKAFTSKGTKTKATFHSFRHSFRDAMRRATVPEEIAKRLGRWSAGNESAAAFYGQGFSMRQLKEHLEKVEYPGLDLTHLIIHR